MREISQNSLDLWVKSFQAQAPVIYAFTEASIQELSYGLLVIESGPSLQVRRITCNMLRHDNQLAREVYELAHTGHLGFANNRDDRHIQFRADIAEKLGGSRTFNVINTAKPDQVEEMNAEIDAIDEASYMAMVTIPERTELEKDKKHKSSSDERLLQRETAPKTHGVSASGPKEMAASRKRAELNRDVSRRIEDLNAEEKRLRQERAKKRDDFKLEKKEIQDKSAERKGQIKNEGVQKVIRTSEDTKKNSKVSKSN
jgi:hypothetical protein